MDVKVMHATKSCVEEKPRKQTSVGGLYVRIEAVWVDTTCECRGFSAIFRRAGRRSHISVRVSYLVHV